MGDSTNPNPTISAYYQTRVEHHGAITSDWLAQAQAAVGGNPPSNPAPDKAAVAVGSGKSFNVINEFNY
ncbi:hypothetical protein ACLOJK_040931 [Asimina triloba]